MFATSTSKLPRYLPDFDTFARLAKAHDIVPVYRKLLADRLTPVTAFEVLGRDEHAFLLESVVGGERVGRHSFIATRPRAVYQCKDGRAQLWISGEQIQNFDTLDPLADLRRLIGVHKLARLPELPTFTGGLVGYAGYELARYYEREKLNHAPHDDRNLPDVVFGLYDELVVFDHVDKTLSVIADARVEASADDEHVRIAYEQACKRIDLIVQRLQQPSRLSLGELQPPGDEDTFVMNQTRQQFEAGVNKGLEYIRAGDIFQYVPGVRLRVNSPADPFDVYRALRVINPSPFMFYLKSPGCTLVGSSPEILCRVQGGVVTTRPLAGTRPRGKTDADDQRLEAELLADPKERAEHIMLVDLHRNDIGRVCEAGSVVVRECMTIERYSHVMHISSCVEGRLDAAKYDALDALRVSLPVGTVSGAPKIRAMQIIDELEPTQRGPYGGAVGYLDLAGNLDTCIALRTIVWKNGCFDVQAGAGVVADSIPANEFEECFNKARALLRAVEAATAGF